MIVLIIQIYFCVIFEKDSWTEGIMSFLLNNVLPNLAASRES